MGSSRKSKKRIKTILKILGGATLAGVLAIISVALDLIQVGQGIDQNRNNNIDVTLIAIQQSQLETLKEIATLQPAKTSPDTNDSEISQRLSDLEDNFESLELTRIALSDIANSNEILFEDDFEDGKIQLAKFWEGGQYIWNVVDDGTGNKVYDANNLEGKFDLPRVILGSTEWDNYEINLRFRILEQPHSNSSFNLSFRSSDKLRDYQLNFNTVTNYVILAHYFDVGIGKYERIAQESFNLETEKWHSVRIRAKDDNIQVFIDQILLFNIIDTNHPKGNIALAAAKEIHVQIDDIQIIKLP